MFSGLSISVRPERIKQVASAGICPILKRLYRILIKMFVFCISIALCITGEYSVLEE
jgi:hypothetical protein